MFDRFRKTKPSFDPDTLLAETVARHFPGGRAEGDVAWLGLGDARITCHVNSIDPMGPYQAAALFFRLEGEAFGGSDVFASITGYEENDGAAIISGACLWSCAFGPSLRWALTGTRPPDADPDDLNEVPVVIDGRRFRAYVNTLDRAMMFGGAGSPQERIAATRARLGGVPFLTPAVLTGGGMPLLTAAGPTVVSVFVGDMPGSATVEVKVNGGDWAPAVATVHGVGREPDGGMTLLRELAFLVPDEGPRPWDAAALRRTFAGFPADSEPNQVAGWPGWHAHGGDFGAPLSAADLAAVEARTGPLPADHRDFLTRVGAFGAGPGYGLLWPERVENVVPLAHAGCGVTWVLRLDEPHRGEVWVDASGSDETVSRVAGSFTEWYGDWLDHAVRGSGPWLHWDTRGCASAEMLDKAGRDGVTDVRVALNGGGRYLEPGPLDPCHGCVSRAHHYGMSPSVFAPGRLSDPAHRS